MAQSVMLTERYNVSYIDLKSGLPHNNVSAIFVDSNGFLWIGTYGGGLVRYDGYGMMTPVMWLKSNSCKSIAEDRFTHGSSRKSMPMSCPMLLMSATRTSIQIRWDACGNGTITRMTQSGAFVRVVCVFSRCLPTNSCGRVTPSPNV